ncbi:hypothetical protein [Halocella sp. SP3-1]|uniref:hypothetical protein n=1 Tax=Halocella sp. SP3-1 TaxID=2382161 RepID=UPI000F752C2F|nr:hypothetical protein [Halocella sp. SP3-1]AZO94665.1 hypothetical protein D7D81_08720 [Halocella sp. SP3-1]
MSSYNKNKLKEFFTDVQKKIAEENQQTLKQIFKTLCKKYVDYFPKRKIYIAEMLGKRISYLTGAGKELYVKAVKIPLTDNYLLFIESHQELPSSEIKSLEEFMLSILEIK